MNIKKADMTQAILKQYLNYDPETGHLTWRYKHCSKVIPGNRAGCVLKRSRHRSLKLHGSVYAEHRLIWLWYYGEHPKGHIDHIDHNELNNRIRNLRDITQAENNMNSSKRSDNSSGITGVWFNKANKHKQWMAELHAGGKRVYLKAFVEKEEAVSARTAQALLHGFHKNHGINKPL